ncbi:MAG: GNAT family N-acetyltransferase [Clostridia bacterium]
MNPKFTLVPYVQEHAPSWDRFVMEQSANGTFLQTRRFLSYHPEGRFHDASLMVYQGNELVALCPAADCMAEGKRVLRSHPGSTFGGLILSPNLAHAQKLIDLVALLDAYWQTTYACAELKLTSDLFSAFPSDVLQYALYHAGYTDELEIAAYLPLLGRSYEELRAAYSFNKRYDLKKCEKAELHYQELRSAPEITAFYDLLCLNLQKFDAKPVHTLAELLEFQSDRLKDEIVFLGVRDPFGAWVAGACLFYFRQTRTLHTQYLATDPALRAYTPSTFLYDSVLRYALERGCERLSLGTSTHDRGRVLNVGLMQNKEGYGSLHSLNRIYTKYYPSKAVETESFT